MRHSKSWQRWLSVIAVILLPVAGFADSSGNSRPAVECQVLDNSPQRIAVSFSFGDYHLQGVMVEGQKWASPRLVGEAVMLEKGAPELPKVCRSVIIPDDAEMSAAVVSANYYEVACDVAPSKGNLKRNVDPEAVAFEFGRAYGRDRFFPGELVHLGRPYILRDQRGACVEVFPFQYNPVRGLLRVYTDMTVELTPSGPARTNVKRVGGHQKSPTREFDKIYSAQFLNYEPQLRYSPLDEQGDLLIICYDAWLANVQPLVEHKNGIGINTTLVGVSTIGTSWSAIKDYTQTVYDSSDLAFVLLVGDSAQVPTPTASGGSSDATYAKLAGGDDYPDIVVGRFSAENAAQVDTQVLRTIEYEDLAATQQPWFKRGTGIASSQGEGTGHHGEADYIHMGLIRTELLGDGYTQVDEIYDPGATAAMVTTALNAGRGVVNYCGHGSSGAWTTTGFSSTQVAALTNYNQLPVIFSVACINGQFAGATCFAEAWLRATSGGEPTGAIGAYMSSINQSWAPPMEAQDEFDRLLTTGEYFSFGAMCYAGSCAMMDAYGADGVEMFDTWIVFGDPSLRVSGVAGPPHGLRVTPRGGLAAAGQSGGPFTPDNMQYTLENMNTSGTLEYAVAATQLWVSVADGSGSLAAGETAVVTVVLNSRAGTLVNGTYYDTVSFTNLSDHDGDTTRAVTLQVGVPTVQYQWTMDTDPGWSTDAGWAFGQPTGGGSGLYGGLDPTSGHTGANVYGYNLNGDYTNSLPERYLTATPIDCLGLTHVGLKFWRWLGVETGSYDHARIQASNNGSTWATVWENPSGSGAHVDDQSWTQVSYDISAIADNQPAVRIRWVMGPTDSSWVFCGWNIDDVEVWGLSPGPLHALGDLNCDGAVNAFDIDPFTLALTDPAGYAAAYPECQPELADINGDGAVNAFDIDPFVHLLTGG